MNMMKKRFGNSFVRSLVLMVMLLPCLSWAAGDLSVSSFTYTTPSLNGATQTFSVEAKNIGGSDVTDARLRVFLPSNYTFTNAPSGCQFEDAPHSFAAATKNPDPGSPYSGLKMLYCDYDTVTANADIVLNFDGTASSSNPPDVGDMLADFWFDGTDDLATNNTVSKQITVNAGADVTFQSTPIVVTRGATQVIPPSPGSSWAGSSLTVTVKTKNSGPNAATAAQVQVTLPTPAANFGSVTVPTGTPWACTNSSNTVTCTYSGSSVSSGSNFADIAITGQLGSNLTGAVSFGASIATNGTPPDPVTSNNGPTTVTLNVQAVADLAASKSLLVGGTSTSVVVYNQQAVYRVGMTNNGPNAVATGLASVSDTIGAGWVIGAMPTGCTLNSRTVTCTNTGALANGGSVTFDIPVTAPASGSCPSNTATVALDSSMADTTSGNDSVTISCTWTAANADLSATKQLIGGTTATQVAYGRSATFRIGITNSASSPIVPASGAQVVDVFDAGWTLGTMPAGCTKNGQTVT